MPAITIQDSLEFSPQLGSWFRNNSPQDFSHAHQTNIFRGDCVVIALPNSQRRGPSCMAGVGVRAGVP